MKSSTRSLLGLATAIVIAGFASAESAKPAPPPAPAAKEQKFIRVATLNSVEANREFQANVQLLQTQRQMAMELTSAVDKETDPKKKKELKTQLDTILAKLNENNTTMTKAYGFSLNRNYTMEIQVANIYMLVSDEEAAKFEQEQKDQAAKAAAPKAKK